jgi:hypothetical protein
MGSSTLRAALALLLFALWLTGLLAGVTLGGALHLLLPAAAFAFPWRALRAAGDGQPDPADPADPDQAEPDQAELDPAG